MGDEKSKISEYSRNKLTELLKISNIPEKLDKIKSLPVLALKDVDVQTNHLIVSVLKTITIKELAEHEITPDELKKIRKKGVTNTYLDKWIAACKLINSIEKLEELKSKKIIFMGLDNAGKTSIINLLTKKVGLGTFANLNPTKGVETHEIRGPASTYAIWDFGGQELYRKLYLKQPEKYLIGIDLFFYVIDIQDKSRFKEAYTFLSNVIEILKFLKENPPINILLHKFDPEIEENPNSLNIVNEIQEMYSEKLEGLEHEFFTTSIFNSIPSGDKVISDIQDFLHGDLQDQASDKLSGTVEVIEHIMDLVVKFSMQMEESHNRLIQRLNILEEKVLGPSREIEKIKESIADIKPPEPIKPILIGPHIPSRFQINQELKGLFKKKLSNI